MVFSSIIMFYAAAKTVCLGDLGYNQWVGRDLRLGEGNPNLYPTNVIFLGGKEGWD